MNGYFYHVVQNGQRAGMKGYVLVRTYQQPEAARKWVEKQGKPVWVIESQVDYLAVGEGRQLGGCLEWRWNSGSGWVQDRMPVLPVVG